MEGILLVDKPYGWTSFDVVNYVRKLVAQQLNKKPRHVKVGHSGTLDPAATGLLILCVGKSYTKQLGRLTKLDKCYDTEITLGSVSTTDDSEGQITRVSDQQPSEDEIKQVFKQFVGTIEQLPPSFSAVKVNGQRAYKLARQGTPVQLQPRKVQVYKLELLSYSYPKIQCRVHVGSGTYIRSLARDIGEALACGAYVSSLKRTQIGQAKLHDASTLEVLKQDYLEKHLKLTDVNAIIRLKNDRNEEQER